MSDRAGEGAESKNFAAVVQSENLRKRRGAALTMQLTELCRGLPESFCPAARDDNSYSRARSSTCAESSTRFALLAMDSCE